MLDAISPTQVYMLLKEEKINELFPLNNKPQESNYLLGLCIFGYV